MSSRVPPSGPASTPRPSTADREQRVLTSGAEVRSAGPMRLTGYAALFNSETTISNSFREVIAAGAFRRALARKDDVRALFNHDANHLLGRTTSGTLRLAEDARGLRYEVDLPDTQDGRDLWTLVQRGDVSQSSFAFSVATEGGDEWRQGDGAELPLRVVKDVRLFDVSPVTYPAYAATSVSARAQERLAQLRPGTIAAADWRAQLATLKAKTATVIAAAGRPSMPAAFRADPRSARAWAAQSSLTHDSAVRLRAARAAAPRR